MRRRVGESGGQASLMMLAVIALVLAGGLLLFAFDNALGARDGTSEPPISLRAAPPR